MRTSREFRLVAECCGSAFAQATRPTTSGGKVNWPLFLRLARFHRVQGLVWKAVDELDLEIPDEARRALSNDAFEVAAANLCSARESERSFAAFKRCDLP